MSMICRLISKRIQILAYEFADQDATGPTNAARADYENRIWEAWERNPRLLDRLDKMYFGGVKEAAAMMPQHIAMHDFPAGRVADGR